MGFRRIAAVAGPAAVIDAEEDHQERHEQADRAAKGHHKEKEQIDLLGRIEASCGYKAISPIMAGLLEIVQRPPGVGSFPGPLDSRPVWMRHGRETCLSRCE